MGLTQVPFKLLLLPWILESVDLCEPFKNEVSISPQSSDSPKSKPPWLSNSNVLEAHLPCIGALGWGDHCGAQTTHSFVLNVMCQPGWEGHSGRVDTCVFMAESLQCSPETNTALLIG